MSGSGPVLTIRRAVALVGLNGIRQAASSLRAWPGPLNAAGAAAMQRTMDRVRLAGHTAQLLCPAGYDPEVVYLVTVLQNLGRLLVQYHFPDEAEQIWQLMRPSPPPANAEPGTPEQPGMSEAGASFAVLGVDIEMLGAAVARHWGLGEDVQQMIHRLPRERAARSTESDADVLRTAASAANDVVDAVSTLPAARVVHGLGLVVQRYARVLEIGSVKDVQEALQRARLALRSGRAVSASPPERDDKPADDAEKASSGEADAAAAESAPGDAAATPG
jgi:non-specific serine/threonine protein kinase